MRARFEKITSSDAASFSCRAFTLRRFDYPWHYHPEYELTLIVESSGRRFVGDHIANFHPGDLVFIGPNLPHFWFTEARGGSRRARSIVLQFRQDFLGQHFLETSEMRPVARLFDRAGRGLRITGGTRDLIEKKMKALPSLAGLARLIGLLSIFDALAHAPARERRELSSAGFAPAANRVYEERIGRVCDYINRGFTGRIEQPVAAKIAHLTPPAFSRFFKKKTGRTFSEFVNEVRIGHACKLLAEEQLNSTEICYACGFENLSNFNRRFRELKGSSPREYRRSFARGGRLVP